MMKRMMALVLALMLCAAAATAEQTTDAASAQAPDAGARTNGAPTDAGALPDAAQRGNRGGAGGSVDKSSDAELQTMIAEVAPKFELLTYTDGATGASLQYYLFTPTETEPDGGYPLVMFIPDSSVVGRDASAVLTQGWGGLIWATDAEQAKRACYVLVPVFTETVVDDNFSTSAQIDIAVSIIKALCAQEPINAGRVYATGQSMGGMTSFYLNVTQPELFAASVFVGSQWDVNVLSALEEKTFFYIVAAGDAKASAGQAELNALFDADGAAYAADEWSAQDAAEVQNAAVEALIAQGQSANFVTFALGSTLADGQTSGAAGEHMTSFDYAYRLSAVRDWLFEQG